MSRYAEDMIEQGIREDERAKCIAEIEALLAEDYLFYSDAEQRGIDAAIDRLRSLSPLGLPTTEREQK